MICSEFANCQECIFAESDECPYSMLETYVDEKSETL